MYNNFNYKKEGFFNEDGWIKDGIFKVAVKEKGLNFEVVAINESNQNYYEQNNSFVIIKLDSDIQDSEYQFQTCILSSFKYSEIKNITDGERFITDEQFEEIQHLSYVFLENCGLSGTNKGILYTFYLMDSEGEKLDIEICEKVLLYEREDKE